MLELDPATTGVVRRWQRDNQKRLAARITLKPVGERYPDSDFILRGVLWSKQGNYKMTGCRSKGSAGYTHRYYRVNRGRTHPVDNDVFAKAVPAGMLEDAAMQVLQDATSTFTDFGPAVRAVVGEELMAVTADAETIDKLRQDRQTLQDKIDFYIDEMAILGKEGVKRKTDPLRRDLLDTNTRIDVAERHAESSKPDVGEIVNVVKANCTRILTSFNGLSRLQIRHLLQALVTRVTVDLETREAVMEVHMPTWAIQPQDHVVDPVCAGGFAITTTE
jgi:hypothetical protein